MLALVLAHVDARSGHLGGAEGSFHHRRLAAHEGVDGAVRGGARVDVEQGAAGGATDRVGDRVDHRLVAAFREVGHALDDLSHERGL